MSTFSRALAGASLAAFIAAPAYANDPPQADIVVTGQAAQPIENPSSTAATITADTIATTVNAVNVEDTIKYLPSLIVRKRHIGDTQAPLATRTSGLGSSARSLIYADGALLSALIGNNNGTASPRWGLVSPQEIASIEVLYGPFSAAYPGNSIGAVVNITTRMPDRLEASITAADSVQRFDQYATHGGFPARQIGATLGDRFGPLSLFVSADRTVSDSQPLSYVTTPLASAPASGGVAALDRTGQPIAVLGAGGLEHQAQSQFKAKAALDLGPVELHYVGGLFVDHTEAHAETYLTDRDSGLPVYTAAFDSGVYDHDERHSSHALSASGQGGAIDWQVIGTRYRFDHDVQRGPTAALTGGAGTITRMDGTGWDTIDAKAALRSVAGHVLSAGGHIDRVTLEGDRYATADWIAGDAGALNLRSAGKTRTAALWAQDAWTIAPPLTLTIGGRYEWWRAYDGVNLSTAPALSATQPALRAARFSPKASLAWALGSGLTLRGSFGEAWRFPTVGELYQIVTSPVPAIPDPNLRPERALSEELALERTDGHGSIRLSLFDESVKDALISQLGPLNGTTTLATFVQNVDRTRAWGVELAVDRRDALSRIDLSGSVTYADATTRADAAFPAAIGRQLPQVPHWKATLVGTWRATDAVSLTAAARYASRMYGTLDNSDIVANAYQGFGDYIVVDLRAAFRVGAHYTLGLGVDNVGNDAYFLYHPFPQRTFHADFSWRL